MSEALYRIKSIKNKNILIRIPKKKREEKKVKGLILNEGPKSHRIAEIVKVGEGVTDGDIKVGESIAVFVQVLNYEFDADIDGLDADYNYFIIFEEQIEAILEVVENEQTSV